MNTPAPEKTVQPILYSFRRCPYAIRARMALQYSGVDVELREVVLSQKPESMLSYSPKGTVPVLVLADATVIDESRDIILWALAVNDPDQWLLENNKEFLGVAETLIDENDSSFKQSLDNYKYNERCLEHPADYYRAKGQAFLEKLEARLSVSKYLMSDRLSVADIAIFPFVRQFAFVDKVWFFQTPYKNLQIWLDDILQSALFEKIMRKYPPWKDC